MFSTLREIPVELEQFANTLHEAGCMESSQIYHALVAKCRRDDIPLTFTQMDITNKYRTTHGESILDCTNLAEHLTQRHAQDNELQYSLVLNESGNLERVFFVIKGGMDIWKMSNGAVVLYDTKHGTNRYGFKLGCFVTVDDMGKTRVLAGSFVRSEDEASFTWAFEKFQNSFILHPVVVFTDSDAAMAAAIKVAWPNTTHLLCTFHLWKNFWEHIRPLFVGKDNDFRTIADCWWRLCKSSDEAERLCFDEKFNNLAQLVATTAKSTGEKLNKQLKWLESLRARKEQWAACYTWRHRTFGIHSTQRAEAIHSAIRWFCSKKSTILGITNDLEQMADEHSLKNRMSTVMAMLRGTIGQKPMLLPGLEKTSNNMSPFPRIMMNAQAALVLQYNCVALDDNSNRNVAADEEYYQVTRTTIGRDEMSPHDVMMHRECNLSDYDHLNSGIDHGIMPIGNVVQGHKTSLRSCSCQYPLLWGLPCRHMLRVMFHLGQVLSRDDNSWDKCLVRLFVK
jgi:hypothetical protein